MTATPLARSRCRPARRILLCLGLLAVVASPALAGAPPPPAMFRDLGPLAKGPRPDPSGDPRRSIGLVAVLKVEIASIGGEEIGPPVPGGVVCAWQRHSRTIGLSVLETESVSGDLPSEAGIGSYVSAYEVSSSLPPAAEMKARIPGKARAVLRWDASERAWSLMSIAPIDKGASLRRSEPGVFESPRALR